MRLSPGVPARAVRGGHIGARRPDLASARIGLLVDHGEVVTGADRPKVTGSTRTIHDGVALSAQGRGPRAYQDTMGADIAELVCDRHTGLLRSTHTTRRDQSAVALISAWQFTVRRIRATHIGF